MSLILAATFLAGLGATKLLFAIGLASMALRYVLAVVAAYLAFLLLIRIWLFYVSADRDVDLAGDGVDLLGHLDFSSGSDAIPAPNLGGGSFSGGGATGSWDVPSSQVARAAPVKSSSGSGSNFDFDLDVDALVLVVLFIALVGALFIAGIYIIYTAPALLSEAAFEALLAGALMRRAKKIDRPGWVGAVWRATVWPFVAIVVLAGALGWAAKNHCPEAATLRQAWECPSRAAQSSGE